MDKIKTAWEIALERSENIKIDESKIKEKLLIKKGQEIAASYLNNLEADIKTFNESFTKIKKDEENNVKEGIVKTLLNNINLPHDKYFEKSFLHLSNLALALNENSKESLDNILKLYNSYIDSQSKLVQDIKAQYGQMFQQKHPNIPIEQNPEFLKVLERNISALNDQASTMLKDFKQTLSNIL